MILHDQYREHDAQTQGGAEEEVIGGMAGHFTWEGMRCYTIKKRYNGQCCSLRHQQDNTSGRHG
jgi:hypothetical protein